MNRKRVIFWFRQDLRLQDNPGLAHAISTGTVLPLYIFDDGEVEAQAMGEASRWWLHKSLTALNVSLQGKLWVMAGKASEIILRLVKQQDIQSVVWSRCYERPLIERDKIIKAELIDRGIHAKSFNASLLLEPWELLKGDGIPYRVFTPYYRRALERQRLHLPASPAIDDANWVSCDQSEKKIDQLNLLPKINWYEKFDGQWQPGEAGGLRQMQRFTQQGLSNYKAGRDFPALQSVSRLSPHLCFGEVCPANVWNYVRTHCEDSVSSEQAGHFLRELTWREFSYYLLYHFPGMTQENFRSDFDRFPWCENAELFSAWAQGKTGYPLVDAGMRELWQTGYMHNRVRMITASFLTKNLLIDWRKGASWFWGCLLDADVANNSCSWQWVAGSGADAAPYFRIFNPVTQSLKFDSEGHYIRKYVPELSAMPNRHIHAPSDAPETVLQAAGISLGDQYPQAIVNLKETRERALDAYKSIKL